MKKIIVIFFLFFSIQIFSADMHDVPYIEVELKLVSFDKESITAILNDGKKVILNRSSISKPITSSKFQIYKISLNYWRAAKFND